MSSRAEHLEQYYLGTLPRAARNQFLDEQEAWRAIDSSAAAEMSARTERWLGWRHVNDAGVTELDAKTRAANVAYIFFVLVVISALWLLYRSNIDAPISVTVAAVGAYVAILVRLLVLRRASRQQESLVRPKILAIVQGAFVLTLGVVTLAGLFWRAIGPLTGVPPMAFIGPVFFWSLVVLLDPMGSCSNYSIWRGRHRGYVLLFYLSVVLKSLPMFIPVMAVWGLVVGVSPAASVVIGVLATFVVQMDEMAFEPLYRRLVFMPIGAAVGAVRGIIFGVAVVLVARAVGPVASPTTEILTMAWMSLIVTSWMAILPRRAAIAMRNSTKRVWAVWIIQMLLMMALDCIVIYGVCWWVVSSNYSESAAWTALVVATFSPYLTGRVVGILTRSPLVLGPVPDGALASLFLRRRWRPAGA